MTESLICEYSDQVLQIRFNRADKKNALTSDMYQRFHKALSEARCRTDVHAVLVCGSDDCFTAGNDLGEFLDPSLWSRDSDAYRLVKLLPDFEKPLIAAVNGPAIGIGTTLLLHCDLVIADKNGRFQTPFVNLGLPPEAGSTYLLPRMAGHRKAAELLLLGEPFDAETARAIGLVNRICAPGQATPEGLQLARRIGANPARTVQHCKQLMKQAGLDALHQRIDEEAEAFARSLRDPETREILRQWAERYR